MKVLIIYASAGDGHRKATEAVYKAFLKSGTEAAEVEKIDALNYTNFFFKIAYPSTYIFLVKYCPFLWGLFFHLLNLKAIAALARGLRYCFNFLNGRKLIRYVLDKNPDVIICAHFFSAQLIASLRIKSKLKGKVLCVVTDFGVHRFWINKGTDYYMVASDITKKELETKGVPPDKIIVSGIPVEEKFSIPQSRTALRNKFGLEAELLTILVMSGGFGVGPLKRIVHYLNTMVLPLQIVVICGKNEKLYQYFAKSSFKKLVKVYGYVHNMDEFMSAADMIVSKSGGLTVSESLVKALPMLIISPIPGQEARNAEVMSQYNAAIKIYHAVDLTKTIELLVKDNCSRLKEMKQAAKVLSKPSAANKICHWVKENLLSRN
ncbi:MAG: hypothetical protein KKF93_05825 [Candidatus Omnitrophica bacterium]|nr:hypothetical protein [Candidatus Omnitrophota bacterium]